MSTQQQDITISDKAKTVITLVKSALTKTPTGVTFLSLKGYKNSTNEIADHLINIGINYENTKAKDINFLRTIDLTQYTFKSSLTDILTALTELINELDKPDTNRSNGQILAYMSLGSGLKVHIETGALYIYGYSVNKTIIQQGDDKKPVNSSVKTIAKNELRKLLKTGNFRQYVVNDITTLKGGGDTIEIG
jgi:hypothetical protein